MPLNPNGKIDKPALPFPDTAQAAGTSAAPAGNGNPTEETMRKIWSSILPNAPTPIPLDESFFDLGGHSILATRLIFEIRKVFVVDAPLGLIFDEPTISGLVGAIDSLRNADLGLSYKNPSAAPTDGKHLAVPNAVPQKAVVPAVSYGQDYEDLLPRLQKAYEPLAFDFDYSQHVVFLTGATGFLGAFVLRDLLNRPSVSKVIVLVRAKDVATGLERLKSGSTDRGVWDDKWVSEGKLEVVVGDLAQPRFGLADAWDRIAAEADVVLHNGALVHWVYPYEKLRAPNVLATLTAIELASTKKQKLVTFVSSTSAIDSEYYIRLSDSLSTTYDGVPESDDLEGARSSLKTGYGQSKWVSEKLLMEAGKRGLNGHIIRPGYVVGDSRSAVTNTDDFLWRMVKGCVQLGLVPNINNTVNMVPVDHVAAVSTLAAVAPLKDHAMSVLHVTAKPLPTYNSMLSTLAEYGYQTTQCEYLEWRRKLEQHVMVTQDNALYPLLHFVLDDLPTSTKSPHLDDRNTTALLRPHLGDDGVNMTVGDELMGKYLAWLTKAEFLPAPSAASSAAKQLPALEVDGPVRAAGRSGA
jgi:L-2-aminoadipate reductase